jgi:hypothetical protein
MLAVGENFLVQTIEGQCLTHMGDSSGKVMYDLDSLIILMRMLGFLSSSGDKAEMRAWFMNNKCIVKGPSYQNKSTIFLDKDKMIQQLKYLKRDTCPEEPNRT